jgi:hypothetical protein
MRNFIGPAKQGPLQGLDLPRSGRPGRRNDGLRLRIRDIDLSARLITVRSGKGDKDRTTCLPASLIPFTAHQRAA